MIFGSTRILLFHGALLATVNEVKYSHGQVLRGLRGSQGSHIPEETVIQEAQGVCRMAETRNCDEGIYNGRPQSDRHF